MINQINYLKKYLEFINVCLKWVLLLEWTICLLPHAKGSSNLTLEVMAYTLLPLKRKGPKLEVIHGWLKKAMAFH
jgi:hypothetical protein